jgi:hypothetical protein
MGQRHQKARADLRSRILGSGAALEYNVTQTLPNNTWTLCESYWQTQVLQCPPERLLFIESVAYHRPSLQPCLHDQPSANAVCAGATHNISKIIDMVQGGFFKFNQMPQSIFGDPCPMVYKQVDIKFQCLTEAELKTKLHLPPDAKERPVRQPR